MIHKQEKGVDSGTLAGTNRGSDGKSGEVYRNPRRKDLTRRTLVFSGFLKGNCDSPRRPLQYESGPACSATLSRTPAVDQAGSRLWHVQEGFHHLGLDLGSRRSGKRVLGSPGLQPGTKVANNRTRSKLLENGRRRLKPFSKSLPAEPSRVSGRKPGRWRTEQLIASIPCARFSRRFTGGCGVPAHIRDSEYSTKPFLNQTQVTGKEGVPGRDGTSSPEECRKGYAQY
jgi:hypothetical protein